MSELCADADADLGLVWGHMTQNSGPPHQDQKALQVHRPKSSQEFLAQASEQTRQNMGRSPLYRLVWFPGSKVQGWHDPLAFRHLGKLTTAQLPVRPSLDPALTLWGRDLAV